MPLPIIAVSVNAAWNLTNFRQSLLQGLVAHGYRVVAIAPPDGNEGGLDALGVEYRPIHMKARGMSPFGDIRILAAYLRTLGRLRPAAYLGFTIKPNVYGGMACQLLGIPRIANIAGLGTGFLCPGLLNQLVRTLYRVGLRDAERVFFQNAEDRDRFVAHGLVVPSSTDLLPGSGIDLKQFKPHQRLPDGRTVFLMVTRLLRAKGVAEFVKAAGAMRERRGEAVVFRLLGIRDASPGGVDDASLARWRNEGHVEIIDAVSDIRPIVATADCVVLPSYYPEGTPRSLLEAMAMGKAIVTTDTPGCRDVVDEGRNGYLCAPRDVGSLIQAMERYADAPPGRRVAMSDHSRAMAEARFDDRFVVAKYLEVLRSFPRRRSRRPSAMKMLATGIGPVRSSDVETGCKSPEADLSKGTHSCSERRPPGGIAQENR